MTYIFILYKKSTNYQKGDSKMKAEKGNLTNQAGQAFDNNPDEIRYLFFSQKAVDHKIKLAEERGPKADTDYSDAYKGRQSRADVRVNVASVSGDLTGTSEVAYTQDSASLDDR